MTQNIIISNTSFYKNIPKLKVHAKELPLYSNKWLRLNLMYFFYVGIRRGLSADCENPHKKAIKARK